jgi:hypothetical protein
MVSILYDPSLPATQNLKAVINSGAWIDLVDKVGSNPLSSRPIDSNEIKNGTLEVNATRVNIEIGLVDVSFCTAHAAQTLLL